MKQSNDLKAKCDWVRRETLRMHKLAPGIRIASSLSPVEILCALFYGGLVKYDPNRPDWNNRDRVIISKGHGGLAIYPILADLGFLDMGDLDQIGQEEAALCIIPEPITPGIETANGSVGHGLGGSCGRAIALRNRGHDESIFVLCGDGEFNSGAIWEAVMFAAKHKLDSINLILDDNKRSMLGDQIDIMGLEPYSEKLAIFGWDVTEVDGHNVDSVHIALQKMKNKREGRPKAIVAHTIKGHMVPELERNPISHVAVLSEESVDRILKEWS